MLIAKALFWFSTLGLLYLYAGYPAIMWALAAIFKKTPKKGDFAGSVSVVIAAHNEERLLPQKLKSLLEVPSSGRIAEIVVASDGSTDRTVEALRSIRDARVCVVEFAERRGKASILNDVIPRCKSEIIILADARQTLHPAAIDILASNFTDEQVGAVSGAL